MNDNIKVKGVGDYGSNYHCSFSEMCFAIPSKEMGELEWRLRYSQEFISGNDMLVLASLISSYRALTYKTQKKRNHIFENIKKALAIKDGKL